MTSWPWLKIRRELLGRNAKMSDALLSADTSEFDTPKRAAEAARAFMRSMATTAERQQRFEWEAATLLKLLRESKP